MERERKRERQEREKESKKDWNGERKQKDWGKRKTSPLEGMGNEDRCREGRKRFGGWREMTMSFQQRG